MGYISGRTKDTTKTIYNLVKTAPKDIKKTPKMAAAKTAVGVFKDPVARANMLELKKAELIADGRRLVNVRVYDTELIVDLSGNETKRRNFRC